jgi:hypothetical protein
MESDSNSNSIGSEIEDISVSGSVCVKIIKILIHIQKVQCICSKLNSGLKWSCLKLILHHPIFHSKVHKLLCA